MSVFPIVICISELNWHLSDRNRQKVSESPIDSSNSVHVHLHSAQYTQCTLAECTHAYTEYSCTMRSAHLYSTLAHLYSAHRRVGQNKRSTVLWNPLTRDALYHTIHIILERNEIHLLTRSTFCIYWARIEHSPCQS